MPTGLAVHPCAIYSLAATKNMRWMFTGGDDGFIRKYDFMASMNGSSLLTAVQKHGLVDSIQNSGVMVSAWEVEEAPAPASVILGPDGAALPTPSTPTKVSPVHSMAVHSEALFLLAGCESGNVNLYTVRHDEGQVQHVLRGHEKPVSVLALARDERAVMSGAWDRKVVRWDLDTGAVVREFGGFNSHVSAIAFRPTADMYTAFEAGAGVEDTALILSFDGRVGAVDPRNPSATVRNVSGGSSAPPWGISLSWSPDGQRFYVGRRNGTVDEYDFGEGRLLQSFRLPRDSGPVTSVHCMPNNRHIVCCSFDNIRLWDLHYQPPEAADGASIAGASANGGTAATAAIATAADTEFLQPIVPFSIVPGHHGGVVGATLTDWSCRYMVTVSGNRGWDGVANNMCLLYSVKGE
ncbi:WD40-repeat-containing domain protein [Chytriomyces sp. MP71]|nr:WD40-repeat-containing domain protein [Chytriomyces sp. MP71]